MFLMGKTLTFSKTKNFLIFCISVFKKNKQLGKKKQNNYAIALTDQLFTNLDIGRIVLSS